MPFVLLVAVRVRAGERGCTRRIGGWDAGDGTSAWRTLCVAGWAPFAGPVGTDAAGALGRAESAGAAGPCAVCDAKSEKAVLVRALRAGESADVVGTCVTDSMLIGVGFEWAPENAEAWVRRWWKTAALATSAIRPTENMSSN